MCRLPFFLGMVIVARAAESVVFIDPIYASILQEHGEWFLWWEGQMTKAQY